MGKELYQVILEQTAAGKIEKNTGIELLRQLKADKSREDDRIAIIGMSGKFPSCQTLEDFWDIIEQGVNLTGDFPRDRRAAMDMYKSAKKIRGEYLNGAFLSGTDLFDYRLFGLSKREASTMAPVQRIMLEVMYDALLDAGYPPCSVKKQKVGVFVGHSDDLRTTYGSLVNEIQPDESALSIPGNLAAIVPGRLSYYLDLKGPCMLIDTACSSFLTALHTACDSLRKDCDMAVVGGIKINLLPVEGQVRLGMESGDGFTRTFSDDSDGTGMGEGAGAVVLKPLRAALESHDGIIAVIRSSAVNQDGATSGITVPNVESQTSLLQDAWDRAGLTPDEISYIEAHGTGTRLGDPIETEAIAAAAGRYTKRRQFCGIGSVKSNIGHLYEGAGAASVLKACLMLRHRCIPPTLFFDTPNRKTDFTSSPVYVVDKAAKVSKDTVMRVGVSAFGFSGTNCHVILEEYPSRADDGAGIFTLSGADREALLRWAEVLLKADCERFSMKDVCYTQNVRREHEKERVVIYAESKKDLKDKLRLFVRGRHAEGIWTKAPDDAKLEPAGSYGPAVKRYLAGEEVDWSEVYREFDGGVVSLPTPPKNPVSCWFSQNMSAVKQRGTEREPHWLADDIQKESHKVFKCVTALTSESNPVISDHKVLGEHVLPGTAYIEIIHEMMKDRLEDRILHICGLELLQPIRACADHPTVVETTARLQDDGSYEITICSVDSLTGIKESHGQAVVHLCGRTSDPAEETEPAGIPKHADYVPIDQSELAKGFIEFGPRWNTLSIGLLKQDEDTCWARVQAPEEFAEDFQMMYLHPSLLDMAVNALALTSGEPHLPYKYNSIRVFGPVDRESYTRFQVQKEKTDQIISYDLLIYNSTGRLCMQVEGYMVKKVQNIGRFSAGRKTMLHCPEWVAENKVHRSGERTSKRVLYIRTEKGGSLGLRRLEQGLAAGGSQVVVTQLEDFLTKEDRIWNDPELMVLEIGENTSGDELQRKVLLLKFLQLSGRKINRPCRIAVWGTGAHKVGGSGKISPGTASDFSLLRSGLSEIPFSSCVFLDVDEESSFETVEPLFTHSDLDEYVVRQDRIYVETFVPMEKCSERPEVRNKNILITGGFGGIGMCMARYFVSGGAASVSILSRRDVTQLSEIQRKAFDRLCREAEACGTEISCYKGDVCDITALRDAADRIHKKAGNISVIVHCAGVAGAGAAAGKTEEQFIRVLEPKITGTRLLYEVFSEEARQMYLMSSIASITGIPGQCDYSAANAFLNGFAWAKSDCRCRVRSICWPSWSDTGMAKDLGFDTDTFMKSISSEQAVAAFDAAAMSEKNQMIIGQWNPDILDTPHGQILEKTAVGRKLKEWHLGYPASGRKNPAKKRQVKLTGRPDNAYTPSEIRFAEIWADVLEADEIDIYANFNDLGGNSILASYLVRELENEYPGKFDITDIFSYSTVFKLSKYFDEKNSPKNREDKTAEESNKNSNKNAEDILEMLAAGEISVEEAAEYL